MRFLWQVCSLVVSLAIALPAVAEPDKFVGAAAVGSATLDAIPKGISRFLQDSGSVTPTIDEVDNVIFSRPPHSGEETSSIVYGSVAGFYVLCAIVLLVGANLDASERRRRRARAIVPEESVPCAIAEQYYLDEYLVNMRSSQDFEARKQRKGFCSFLLHYGAVFPDLLSRQHLFLSVLVQAVPTFTRLKRGALIVVQLHLCMLTSAFAYNVFEHDKPDGRYEMLTCSGALMTSTCTATLPMSLLAAAIGYPAFRFLAYRQMRLTCFTSQSHPSSSQFPLNVRKFARIPAKSAWESVFCMRNAFERRQVQVLQSRSLAHRVMQMLWRTTQPSAKDLRFYGVFTSWCILLVMVAFVFFTLFYLIMYTAYLKDEIVYHWLAWTLTMFFSSIFLFEPLQIFCFEVVWSAFVANFAQRWSFGAHALAGTTRYKEVVRAVEQQFIKNLRVTAATRIQRWWLAVLDVYRAINEQTSTEVNFQTINQKNIHQKKYMKVRKWCMRVEVQECYDLEQVAVEDLMSPLIRLQCDTGNPSIMQTKVAWDAHRRATFNEVFLVDIKESQAMYISVWSKTPTSDEFIGRGYFDFHQIKSGDREKPEGQDLKITLHDIEHGEKRSRTKKVHGYVDVRVKFIDPSKDPSAQGDTGEDTAWMLPKHRMQFALSKMGGRMKVSQMLGGLGTPMSQPVPVTVPSAPLRLDTGSNWHVPGEVGGRARRFSNRSTTPTGGSRPSSRQQTGRNQTSRPSSRQRFSPPVTPPPSSQPPAQAASISLNPAGRSAVQESPSPLPGTVGQDDGWDA
jgi:hypothetical protein